jgi:nucleotidyltransferase/DNA polymerase involved in DNA repair
MHAAEEFARALQQSVYRETALSCSLGLSTLRVCAKIASDIRKPYGITVVPPGEEPAFLAPLPVRKLPGVGPKAAVSLAAARVTMIGQLARLNDAQLDELLPGKHGLELRDRARGIDPRGLLAPSEPKQISAEDTFEHDLRDRTRLHAELDELAQTVAERLAANGYGARTVTVKRKYADFRVRSSSISLPVATDNPARIAALAKLVLDNALLLDPGALRLLGISCSRFQRSLQLELPL